jgi:hypothetical protein
VECALIEIVGVHCDLYDLNPSKILIYQNIKKIEDQGLMLKTAITNRGHSRQLDQGILNGEVCVQLTSCLTGLMLVSFANKNKNCQLAYSLFQTSQTGVQ